MKLPVQEGHDRGLHPEPQPVSSAVREPEHHREGDRRTARLVLFAMNLWTVTTWLPAALGGRVGSVPAASLAGVALVLGTVFAVRADPASRGSRLDRRIATTVLLIGFPWAIGWNVLALPIAPSLAYVLSAAASLIAYGWAAVDRLTPIARPLDGRPVGRASARKDDGLGLRRIATAIVTLGAAALVFVAPWSDRAARARLWGVAAAEGEVLTALTGGILATVVIVLFWGDMLRNGRRIQHPWRSARFVVGLVVAAAALAIVAWRR